MKVSNALIFSLGIAAGVHIGHQSLAGASAAKKTAQVPTTESTFQSFYFAEEGIDRNPTNNTQPLNHEEMPDTQPTIPAPQPFDPNDCMACGMG